MRKSALLGVLAGGRYSRQIVSYLPGAAVNGTAGATSLAVPWPTAAGLVAANVLNYLVVALKPGAVGAGSITTPSGWTLLASHTGGGYGATLGAGTGNAQVYLFTKQNDNTASGNLAVTIVPGGGNGVACANMGRIEKLKGSWKPVVTAVAEATANVPTGIYNPSMDVAPGDFLLYGFALSSILVTGTTLSAGAGLTAFSPAIAVSSSTSSGYGISHVSTGRRAQRGSTLGSQALAITSGDRDCRGPLVVARIRVR